MYVLLLLWFTIMLKLVITHITVLKTLFSSNTCLILYYNFTWQSQPMFPLRFSKERHESWQVVSAFQLELLPFSLPLTK